jgi:hypothetical protein
MWLRWRRVRKQIIAAAAALTTAAASATEKDHFDPFTETLFVLSTACFSAA